ncbi:50S ribosomal protein L25 [Candidatus Roizmanbacteria bacterium]|nr:50S ribosomal protein L25 [Candidatus Roizmanbacteria bacterium]
MPKAKSASSKPTLAVEKRDLTGKKVKKLRDSGKIPANIFGPDFTSTSIAVFHKDFTYIYKTAKETGVVYLKLGSVELPVLIKNVQRHPVNDDILHIDFRKIDLSKKVETKVPIAIVGVSIAVSQKSGVLLHGLSTLRVEALPTDIPQKITVDIGPLKELRAEIKVGDLPKSAKFVIKDDPERVIVSVVEHKEESITPETTAATPQITTAAPVEEGVAPAGTEVKTEPAPATKEKASPPANKK